MIIMLTLLTVFILANTFYFYQHLRYKNTFFEPFLSPVLAIAANTVLTIACLGLVAQRGMTNSWLTTRPALVRTYQQERCSSHPLEMAAVAQSIGSWNSDLAQAQYWASNPWTSWFVPAKVLATKPIDGSSICISTRGQNRG